MRIVFLNVYQGLVNRGAERSTNELCRRLSPRHHIILFQAGRKSSGQKYDVISLPVFFPGIADSSSSFLRKFYLDDWSLQILFFTLFAVPFMLLAKIDILIPVNGGWQVLICKIISKIKKCRLVIIGRAGIGRDDAWNLLFNPDLFIALTTRGRNWAEKKNSRVKIISLPNGVDIRKFHPRISAAGINLPAPVIISASALTADKRVDLVIKAVSRMNSKASLLILGKGPLLKKLSVLAESLLGKSRFEIIAVPSELMAEFYNAGRVFTMSSVEEEAFGNVYLEALACNLPVVAPEGYRKEIIGSAGLYFREGNPDDYARKLELALKKNFKRIPRQRAELFSWDKIIPIYESALLKLTENK